RGSALARIYTVAHWADIRMKTGATADECSLNLCGRRSTLPNWLSVHRRPSLHANLVVVRRRRAARTPRTPTARLSEMSEVDDHCYTHAARPHLSAVCRWQDASYSGGSPPSVCVRVFQRSCTVVCTVAIVWRSGSGESRASRRV